MTRSDDVHLEGPVSVGVDELEGEGYVGQAVVVGHVGWREGVHVLLHIGVGRGVTHVLPVEAAVTAASAI